MSIALLQKGLHLLYPLNFQPPQDMLQGFFLQPLPPEPAVHHKAAEGGGIRMAFRPLVLEKPKRVLLCGVQFTVAFCGP